MYVIVFYFPQGEDYFFSWPSLCVFRPIWIINKNNRKGGAECAQDPCAQVSELYLLENDTIFDLHRMLGKVLQKMGSQKESSW